MSVSLEEFDALVCAFNQDYLEALESAASGHGRWFLKLFTSVRDLHVLIILIADTPHVACRAQTYPPPLEGNDHLFEPLCCTIEKIDEIGKFLAHLRRVTGRAFDARYTDRWTWRRRRCRSPRTIGLFVDQQTRYAISIYPRVRARLTARRLGDIVTSGGRSGRSSGRSISTSAARDALATGRDSSRVGSGVGRMESGRPCGQERVRDQSHRPRTRGEDGPPALTPPRESPARDL